MINLNNYLVKTSEVGGYKINKQKILNPHNASIEIHAYLIKNQNWIM